MHFLKSGLSIPGFMTAEAARKSRKSVARFKKQSYDYDYDSGNAAAGGGFSGGSYESGSNSYAPAKSGYSAGSGLRSIAQGSADQAGSAVANQHAAANQAAYVAKNTLAQVIGDWFIIIRF